MYRAAAIGTVVAAAALTVWWTARARSGPPAPEPPAGVPEPAEAPVRARVLRLAGDPAAKGEMHGRAFRDEIRAWLERTLPEAEGLRRFALETCGARLRASLPDAVRAEIEGVAKGAGIRFEEALYLSTRFQLAAYGMERGAALAVRLAGEAAVGPGPRVRRRFAVGDPGFGADDLVLFVHDDADPPLLLVGLPGMVGGLLGMKGDRAAALVPTQVASRPVLTGLAWPLWLRALLETGAPAPAPRFASVAWLRDGRAGTLSIAPDGATWYPARGDVARTSDEPVAGDDGERDAAAHARLERLARDLLAADAGGGGLLVTLERDAGGHAFRVVRGARRAEARVPAR